jgi:hypothetical protein
MYICVDFDGTIVTHEYPKIGKDIGAFPWLKKFQEAGAQLILWTMRSGMQLHEAVEFCRDNGIEFFGVNENPTQKGWTQSPKAYGQIYIDDAAIGCPLIYEWPPEVRPFVDWDTVGPEVMSKLKGE